jgi:type IV pilus assembly protein PilM
MRAQSSDTAEAPITAETTAALCVAVQFCSAGPAGGATQGTHRGRQPVGFSFFRRPRPLVGLDIGSSAIKAVELKPNGRGLTVAAFATEPVPPDAIVDGTLLDPGAVADCIRRLFERRGFTARDVVASLSGNAVIVKKIALPIMTDQELDDSIHWEAEQYIPFDIQDVHLDYQVLDRGGAGSGKTTMDVLLVAAKKEQIANYTSIIAQAGRAAVVVDVDAFALQNAYEVNYGTDPSTVVALLNAGASAINVNIVIGEQSVFTRDISLGGKAYTEALQKDLSLPFDLAEQAKCGALAHDVSPDDVRMVVRATTENVLLEIQKTFDFFKATTGIEHIDRIMLSGGASRVAGFAEALHERFATAVDPLDPFRRIAFEPGKFGVDHAIDVAPTAAVAVGLALRRVADR